MRTISTKGKSRRNITTILCTTVIILSAYINKYCLYIQGYSFPLGDILLIIMVFGVLLFSLNKPFLWPRRSIAFLAYIFFSAFIIVLFQGNIIINNFINVLTKILCYSVVYLLVSQLYFDLELGCKIYIYISVFFSIYLLIQALVYQVWHIQLPSVLLRNLRLNYYFNAQDASTYNLYADILQRLTFRPSSLFLEVAHFAQYTIPALALCLYEKIKMRSSTRWLFTIIITIANLLSFSANAVVFLIVVWGWLLLKYSKEKKGGRIIVAALCIAAIAIIIAKQTDVFSAFYDRVSTIWSEGGTTGTQRILRGYAIFAEEKPIYKLFGFGMGNIRSCLVEFGITTQYDGILPIGHEYMNSLSYILVGGGLIGFCLYIATLLELIKNLSFAAKGLLLLLVCMMISSSIYLTPTYMLPLVFVYADYYKKKRRVLQYENINYDATLYR